MKQLGPRRTVVTLGSLVISMLMVVSVSAPASTQDGSGYAPGSGRQAVSDEDQAIGTVISRLRIPAIGMEETVRAGVNMSVIDQGVAHWTGTAQPGQQGNVVLAGHRTTYTAPFNALDRLDIGDLVYMSDGSGMEFLYKVSDVFVVEPTDIWISYDNGASMVTMFACHPKGSARFRIVVQATLVAPSPIL